MRAQGKSRNSKEQQQQVLEPGDHQEQGVGPGGPEAVIRGAF